MAKQKVVLQKTYEYDRLKCLLIAAYLLGQEDGLNRKTYAHPDSVRKRENLVQFFHNGLIK
jgi:hypothetical protein